MDLNAMMQAASQDPQAAAFLKQLLSGGTPMGQRLPEVQAQKLRAPGIMEMSGTAPMPVFDPAKSAMDKLLAQWQPPAVAAPSPVPTDAQPGPTAAGGTLDQMAGIQTPETLGPGTPIGLSPEQQQQQLGQGTLPPDILSSLLGRMLGG